ncbi:MAG: hypothetical protein Q7T80_09330, partial [Methanoregula sp.]|nr:hypothetical protein [Methanoregula sp.]
IQAKSQTGEQVRELAEELERTKAAFNEVRLALSVEKKAHELLEGELDAAIRERDATLQSVQGAHDQTKSDLDLHKKNLLQLNQDLEAATRIYSSLLADFKDASSRIDELESELNSAGLGKEQASVQIRSLADDLERAKVELEAEQRIRRIAETNLQTETQVTARLKGDIARSTAEHEGLKTALEQEKRLHFATVEKARAATLAKELADHEFTAVKEAHERKDGLSAAKIQELSADFERALARLRELEQEVKTLEYEKTAAEARVESLSDEIQQARTALADEWENHMDDEERLAATERKAVLLEQSLSGPVKGTPERERKWAVVMKQTDLPAEFRPAPKAIVITHAPAIRAEPVVQATPDNDPEVSLSLEIEDLFEDVQPGPGKEERMTRVPPSPLAGSAAETQDMATEEDPANEPEPDEGELEADVAEEDEGESDDEEVEDQRKNLDDFMTTPSGYGISFNRQQWFDLLKWSHHSGALSQEQRMQIVRMGRLIQNGRKLTAKQDEQVREMIVLVQTLGYRFH